MQTPEQIAHYERGELHCAKCMHFFGENVLLDGKPVKCPACSHLTIPVLQYSPEGKKALESEERRDAITNVIIVVSIFSAMFGCCGGFSLFIENDAAVALLVLISITVGFSAWAHHKGLLF